MASFLYGIQAMAPLTFVIVPRMLAGVALFACYLPAQRTHVDPIDRAPLRVKNAQF